MATIKGKVGAWLTDGTQAGFIEGRSLNDENAMIAAVRFLNVDMTSMGWTRIGSADVTLEIDNDDTIRQNMIESLREQKKSILAKAHSEATTIEERIQNLLAITFDEVSR